MPKTLETQFAEWMQDTFGYGYGTGEMPIIEALKVWFDTLDAGRSHDYRKAEAALGAPVEWLLVNALCKADIMEYGTSPRFGWLTPQGTRLAQFMRSKSAKELYDIGCSQGDYVNLCTREMCYCDDGDGSKPCINNSFWNSNR